MSTPHSGGAAGPVLSGDVEAPQPPLPAASPAHGTYAGWNNHQRTGTPICGPCRDAGTAYVRAWRLTRGRTKHTYPTGLPAALLDQVGALGAVAALSWRWSA